MSKKYIVLFNPLSYLGNGVVVEKAISSICPDSELVFESMPSIKDFFSFFKKIKKTPIIISGGDGTLNYFVNHVKDINFSNKVFYYPTGLENNFYKDIDDDSKPLEITDLIKKLPTATIDSKDLLFVNGISLGFVGKGYELGVLEKEKKDKEVDFQKFVKKQLKYHYKPRKVKINVDSSIYEFDKVWLVNVMKGKYLSKLFVAPKQDREVSKNVSLIVIHGKSRRRALKLYQSMLNNKFIEDDMVTLISGNDISVEFDKSCTCLIDGEVISDIDKYSVKNNDEK